MIVNCICGKYFIYDGHDLIISMSQESFDRDFATKPKFLIINNSDYTNRENNVVDIRIFCWLMNNIQDYSDLFYLKDDNYDRNKILELSKKQHKLIEQNKYFAKQSIIYTKYYKSLNKLFKFDYDKKEFFLLLAKYNKEQELKEASIINQWNDKFKLQYQDLNGIKQIKDYGIKYNFLTTNGKIFNSNSVLSKMDRKKYINLFKVNKNKKYYLIDFKNFEPSMFYFYTNKGKYIHEKFYEYYANRYGLERNEFKIQFVAWLNGATKSVGETLLSYLETDFDDIINIRNSITGNILENCYGHRMIYDKDYKKLGFLLSSTSSDYLLRFYYDLYKVFYNNNKIIFRWMLFDEFFIECDPDFNIEIIKPFFKGLKYEIKEY